MKPIVNARDQTKRQDKETSASISNHRMALAPIKSGENKKKPALVRLFRKHFPDICAVARRRAYNGDMPFDRRLRACRMFRSGTASGDGLCDG